MAGRTAPQAVNAFVGILRQSLSCVTDAVLDVRGGYHPSAESHFATLNGGIPVRLGGDAQVGLVVSLHYRIAREDGPRGRWAVHTVAYYFALSDEDDKEILAYHWHPEGRSRVTWPHLHLGTAVGPGTILSRAHLPTGRVALEQVLRLAITELGVQPRRQDWTAVLARGQTAFEQQRTWA